MSTKKIIIIAVVLVSTVIVGCTAGVGLGVLIFKSPEYALIQIQKDIQEYGIEGLEPYLTGDAKETWDGVEELSDNTIISSIFAFLDIKDYVSLIKSELGEITWTAGDMLKGSDKCTVTLGFNYKDKVTGETTVTLSKIDGDWYISHFTFPDLEKIDF